MTSQSSVAPKDWGLSLWIASNPTPPPAPRFTGSAETEVAIVGAGIAGLSLAHHLGETGTEAVVLEAVQQPVSATAASAGVIAPQLVRTTPNAVLQRLGAETGGRFLQGLAESGRYTFDLVGREAIVCAQQPYGFLNPLSGRAASDQGRALLEEWRPFRQDLWLADAEETRRLTGCDGYSACVVDPSGGGLDPVAYAAGLVASISTSRVRIFRDSPVLRIDRVGERWIVKTANGSLTARKVVLCANGGNTELHPSLTRTVLPLPVLEVATEPLSPDLRAEILPQGHSLTDSSADVFSIRFDKEGRLITASPAVVGMDYDPLCDLINKRLCATIPSYVETPLEFAWKGTAWLASTLLPRLLIVDDGLIAVQACNGRGLGLNTLIGREAARWLTSSTHYQPMIPVEKPRAVFGYAFAQHIPTLMMAASTFIKKVQRSSSDGIRR